MKYNIDISVTYDCNIRCKYCFEQKSDLKYINEYMSLDTAKRTVEYIKFLKEKYDDEITITFYGGEPLLNLDIIKYIMEQLTNKYIKCYDLVTNGILIEDNLDTLIYLNKLVDNKLFMRVSYDYCLQDKNRHKDSYKKIRNNIILLHKHNINVDTISVLMKEDFKNIDKVIFDYIKLRRFVPDLNFVFNIDRYNLYSTEFDEEQSKLAFEKIKHFIKDDKNIFYNHSCLRNTPFIENCIFKNIYCCITSEGGVYPIFNIAHDSPMIRNMFYMGNINESFDKLEQYHIDLFKKLNFNTPQKCLDCDVKCRILPWDTIKNGKYEEFNTMPDEEHCKIQKIISEYI